MRGSVIVDADRRARRNVLHEEGRQAFAFELGDGAHHHAEAVRELQALVHPGAGVVGEERGVDLARGEHHLAASAGQVVAIDVDVVELVVGADQLQLAVGVEQRLRVPEPDVLEGGPVALDGGGVELLLRPETAAA